MQPNESTQSINGFSASGFHFERSLKNDERFALLVENSSDFIGVATLDGMPTFINRAGREMVGLPRNTDISTLAILDFLLPEDRVFAEETVLPAVFRHGHWSGEFRLRHFSCHRHRDRHDTGAAGAAL